MSNKDWEIGPVLKNKANSQGTLFRGGTKYSSDKRYPLGYTPERSHAVSESFPRNNFHDDIEDYPSWMPKRRASNAHFRAIVDNIARSTIPLDHLKPRVDDFGTEHPVTVARYPNLPENTYGLYQYSAANDFRARHTEDVLRVQHSKVRGGVPIHEIGHHYDTLARVTGMHNGIDDQRHLGRIEGFADQYEEQHFRDRKGRPVPGVTYPSMDLGNSTPEFNKGYNFQREHLNQTQFFGD